MANLANIRDGINPNYTIEDFLTIYPQFDEVNENALNMYLEMANASIKQARYREHWKYAMGLYLAHYATLYTAQSKASEGAGGTGVITSKSVDGVSVSYDTGTVNNDFAGLGMYKTTQYGQELLTIMKMVGKGGMQIW